MPLFHLTFRGHANLRNHRKIVLVDDARSLVGGMNVAVEYMGPVAVPGRWRDVAMRVEGPAVAPIRTIVNADWAFAAKLKSPAAQSAAPQRSGARAGQAILQVVASGPDVRDDTFYDAILTGLFAAKKRIWIATPYFVPDEALARALVLAARRGVDVRIIVPARSNHRMADLAAGSDLRQVQDAGGHVHLYRPGMMHAKVTIIDDAVATLGSANMDMRSLFLDYEIALFIYSSAELALLATWFESVLESCSGHLPPIGRVRALAEDVGRLEAPLV